ALLNTRYRLFFTLRYALDWNRTIFRTLQAMAAPNLVSVSTDLGMLWADYSARQHLNIPTIRIRMEPPRLSNVPGEIHELRPGQFEQRVAVKLEQGWKRMMREFGFESGVGHILRLKRSCD